MQVKDAKIALNQILKSIKNKLKNISLNARHFSQNNAVVLLTCETLQFYHIIR